MKLLRTLLFVLALTGSLSASSGLAPQASDTVSDVLKRMVGQRVELRLESGATVAGKVEAVGENTVHLSGLTGMELFEAVVVIDDVSAVVARAPAK